MGEEYRSPLYLDEHESGNKFGGDKGETAILLALNWCASQDYYGATVHEDGWARYAKCGAIGSGKPGKKTPIDRTPFLEGRTSKFKGFTNDKAEGKYICKSKGFTDISSDLKDIEILDPVKNNPDQTLNNNPSLGGSKPQFTSYKCVNPTWSIDKKNSNIFRCSNQNNNNNVCNNSTNKPNNIIQWQKCKLYSAPKNSDFGFKDSYCDEPTTLFSCVPGEECYAITKNNIKWSDNFQICSNNNKYTSKTCYNYDKIQDCETYKPFDVKGWAACVGETCDYSNTFNCENRKLCNAIISDSQGNCLQDDSKPDSPKPDSPKTNSPKTDSPKVDNTRLYVIIGSISLSILLIIGLLIYFVVSK